MRNRECLVGLCALAMIVAGDSFAGDLNPPPGAIAPNMKSLDEVEPRIPIDPSSGGADISQPGSYYLTGNLVALGPGGDAITIIADNVTLDLMGHSIISPGGITIFDHGITIEGSAENVRIINGSIIGMEDIGVNGVNGPPAHKVTLENIRVESCGGPGISLGDNARVISCIARSNGGGGIKVGDNAVVERCTSQNNSSEGILCGEYGVIKDCAADNNTGSGIEAGIAARVSDCSAVNNSGNGYLLGANALVRDSIANDNSQDGFEVGEYGTVAQCTAAGNTIFGIYGASHSHITGCSASQNGSAGIYTFFYSVIESCVSNLNDGRGINVFAGQVRSCDATQNGGDGIYADGGAPGASIIDCRSLRNDGNGITMSASYATVRNNECVLNGAGSGGIGIHCSGSYVTIDANMCRGSDVGIRVTAASIEAQVTRNRVTSGAPGYDISNTSFVGTIRTSPVGAGPWDNFYF